MKAQTFLCAVITSAPKRMSGTENVVNKYTSFRIPQKEEAYSFWRHSTYLVKCESESHSVMSDSLWPHGLYNPWNSPGQKTGVGSLSLSRGIFPTQGSNPGLLHCRRILYQLSHKESPRILEWVIYPFTSGSSRLRNWTGCPALQVGSLLTELSGKPLVKCKKFQIQNNFSIFVEWVEVLYLIFISFFLI